MPASLRACRTGPMVCSTKSAVIASNLARVSVKSKCLGPDASAVMKGRLMFAVKIPDNSIFAFSAASLKRCNALRSLDKSMPLSFLNSDTSQSTMRWSKSSPPKRVLPLVDFTSTKPSLISRMDTSKVPPPKS
ncbi:hypothetical protein SDC9_121381 [bioreactor metagenome]|uniref:Uncharacterized protein n=1 Tax=bioreactor metagenome TaxID=1076179 RepID=A0A645CBT8_9ZZZZ